MVSHKVINLRLIRTHALSPPSNSKRQPHACKRKQLSGLCYAVRGHNICLARYSEDFKYMEASRTRKQNKLCFYFIVLMTTQKIAINVPVNSKDVLKGSN